MEEISKIILRQTVGTITSTVVKLGFDKLFSDLQNRLGSLLGDGEQQRQRQRQISTHLPVLTMFKNMYSLAALAAMVAFFFAYWMTRRFGRKISTHLRGAVFLAINGAVGLANRAVNQAKINIQSPGPGIQDVGRMSTQRDFTMGDKNDPLSQKMGPKIVKEVLTKVWQKMRALMKGNKVSKEKKKQYFERLTKMEPKLDQDDNDCNEEKKAPARLCLATPLGGTVHEYPGKMTSYTFFTYIVAAAAVGFILGHSIGISSVYRKMEEDTNANQYSKFDSAVLTMFINMYPLAALAAMVAFFFTYWMTRRFGRKISAHSRGGVGFANRVLNNLVLAFVFSAFRLGF